LGLPLEQVQQSGTVLYYLHDQLGSTRVLTDSHGAIVGSYLYDAYGNSVGTEPAVANPLQYAGQYKDVETGLYYLRARYYDPSTGQFLSRDPMVASTRSPYGYVADNPLNGTDPSGECGLWGNDTCWGHVTSQVGSWAGDVNNFGNTHVFGICVGGSAQLLVIAGVANGCVAFNFHSFALTGTLGGGPALGLGVSGGGGPLYSDAHSVSDLDGPFGYVGVGVQGAAVAGGATVSEGIDDCGRQVHVVQPWVGAGGPSPISIESGVSKTWEWRP
jgi:RHS repeat-associated protein